MYCIPDLSEWSIRLAYDRFRGLDILIFELGISWGATKAEIRDYIYNLICSSRHGDS